MSTGSQAPSRRPQARFMGSIFAALVLLAGCSSDGGYDSASSEADWASAPTGGGYDMAEAPAREGSDWESAPEVDRDMIVTGQLYITVEDPIAAAASATDVVRQAGGRIDARSETAADGYNGGSAWLTLRIPADSLEDTVAKLGELGHVDDYSTASLDVTNQITDLEAQISTLRASTARIEALLDQAQDISDIIDLETELAERQGKLEGLEARQRGLDDQVSMSTIELSLTTEPIVEVEEEDPSSFWDGLVSGWNGLLSFLSGFLVVLGILLPWLVLVAIITLIVVVAVRLRKKRRAARRPTVPHAATVATQPAAVEQPVHTEAPAADSTE